MKITNTSGYPWPSAHRKWAEKKKKTMVLTLGSPLEKGGEKKDLGINPGQSAEKGQEKKKKKPGINPGQPVGPRF